MDMTPPTTDDRLAELLTYCWDQYPGMEEAFTELQARREAERLQASDVSPNYRNVLFPGDPSTCQDDPCACAAADELLTALRLMVSPVSHRPGCLYLEGRGLCCQCGFNDRINEALKIARAAISQYEQKERG